jgi:ribosome-interacting GTPase 1
MIKNLEDKISRLEDKIEAAERDGRSEEYILSLRSELIELRKKENILLEKFNQIGAVGKLSDIPS